MSRAKFIRTRSLGDSLPQMAVVPELNRQAWVELSRAASNLNQIAHHLNLTELKGKRVVNINEINKALIDFRNKLIGASDYFEEDVEEEEEEQEEDEEE
jgi:tRNA U34 5-carboxymethylaminomethyl modifying GTPase MnmE/TrmE